MMDFIQYGGLDLIDKAMRVHAKDDFLAVTLPYLLKVITAVGAAASIEEIQNEGMNLKLCQKCQEIIQKAKNPLGSIQKIVIPKSSDRINRVLRFMDNYLNRLDVQIAALNAVLNFCRNADAPTALKDTDLIQVLVKTVEMHKEEAGVVWRVCMALSILASYNGEISVNILNTGVHEILIDNYSKFLNEPIVQQQILWLIAAFLKWPRSLLVIHKTQKCMEFLKGLAGQQLLKAEEAEEAEQTEGRGSDRIISIAIPVQIRSFLRQTEGKVFVAKSKGKAKQQVFKERRNFDEKPRFGTVDTNIFQRGESGLLAGVNDDDAGNDKGDLPEWEQRLAFNEERRNKQ